MSYVFNPWRAVRVLVRQAREYRERGDHQAAVVSLEAAAANRRRWLATGSFHPQYLKKEKRKR